MNVIFLILLLLAGACFLAAAFKVAARVELVAAGLLLWMVTLIIKAAQALH